MSVSRRILGISDSKSVFVSPQEAPLLADLIRKHTIADKTALPTICYIGAAKGDRPERIADFFDLAKRAGFQPTSLDMYAMKTGDANAYFDNVNAVFIDGGVTRNLIALLKEWDVTAALTKAYQQGTLIAGASAGISMLFDWCISDSIKTNIQPLKGIGLLKGAVCAHYDAKAERRETLAELMNTEPTAVPAFGVEDGVAILFEDEAFVEAFTIHPEARLHLFKREQHHISHTSMLGRRLDPVSLHSNHQLS
ncbi:MAG: Type 1 glutamine amidotransferase-like domain-containing protein [Pseudomonadota bacterium]